MHECANITQHWRHGHYAEPVQVVAKLWARLSPSSLSSPSSPSSPYCYCYCSYTSYAAAAAAAFTSSISTSMAASGVLAPTILVARCTYK